MRVFGEERRNTPTFQFHSNKFYYCDFQFPYPELRIATVCVCQSFRIEIST